MRDDTAEDYAKALNDLSIIYAGIGELTKARDLIERALRRAAERLGPRHPDLGIYLC
jgi:hypothetical protein